MSRANLGGFSKVQNLLSKSSFSWFVGFIALAVGLSFTKFLFLTPLIFIGLLALVLPYSNWGIITRIVISGLLLFVANTALAVVFLFLKLDVTHTFWLSVAWSSILILCGVIKIFTSKKLFTPSAGITLDDLISLGAATIAGLTVFAPFLVSHSLPHLLQIASNSGDNMNHMQLIKAAVHAHGYLQGAQDPQQNFISPQFFGYPLGWHVNVAIFGSFWPTDLFRHTFNIVYLYYAAFAATSASLVYMFCLLALRAGKIAKQHSSRSYAVAAGLLAVTFWALWMFDFVIKGFPNYLMVLALFELLLFFLFEYSQTATPLKTLLNLALSLLILSAIGTTWLFLLPPAAMVVLAVVVYKLYHGSKKNNYLLKWIIPQLVAGLLLLPFLIFQPLTQLAVSASGGAINSPGNITHLDTYLVVALSLVALMITLFYRKSQYAILLGVALVVSLLYAATVSAYQHVTIGHQEYYFYKTLYAVLMIILLIFTPILVAFSDQTLNVLKKLRTNSTRLQWNFVILGFVMIAVLVLSNHSLSQIRHFARGEVDDRIDDNVAKIIAATPLSSSKLPPIFVGACNHANDYLATHLVSTLADRNGPIQQDLYFGGLFATSRAQMFNALQIYHLKRGDAQLTIVSLDYGLTLELKSQLGTLGIDYIDINDGQPKDPGHCQNFVR